MLNIKATIAQKILECIHTISPDVEMSPADIAGWLEYPHDVAMGDLAFPCFRLSKTLRRAPVQIASAIAEKLNCGCEYIDHAENVNG
jgi:arginyl-tRNA synthetase